MARTTRLVKTLPRRRQRQTTSVLCQENYHDQKIEIVWDFVFLGAKIEDSGSCKGEILRRLALGRAAMTAKQDMERQRYNNYNKMQNNKCISFPSSAVWL